jgi:uncharacterized coiled-coil protein SlyX
VNAEFMELWGRSMLAAFQGPNQMDMMAGWMQRTFQEATRMHTSLFRMWGLPPPASPQIPCEFNWEQVWEPLMHLQQLSMQWLAMVPKKEYDAQSEKISRLEEKLAEQVRTIEKLQHLAHHTGPGNDELIHQFQGLINEQSRQFKQLTDSVGEFIKTSAEKAGSQK